MHGVFLNDWENTVASSNLTAVSNNLTAVSGEVTSLTNKVIIVGDMKVSFMYHVEGDWCAIDTYIRDGVFYRFYTGRSGCGYQYWENGVMTSIWTK